jgi:hypothetical protein
MTRPHRFLEALAAALLVVTSAACDDAPPAGAPSPGPAPLRRLNRFEYDRTVRDLLGTTLAPAEGFARDGSDLGFDNQAAVQTVDDALAESYQDAAELLAADAVSRLSDFLPCDPSAIGEDECARLFIETFGKRAYRRPLEAEDIDRLMVPYSVGRGQGAFEDGIRLVITTMLQSPHFLYRVELGGSSSATGALPLDDYEIASRLSYFLWGSMPDEALFAAADAGELGTAEGVAGEARRMLGDPRAREAVRRFHRLWLGLDGVELVEKDPATFPRFDASLPPLWQLETEVFVEHVVFDGAGDLGTLVTAPFSFMNADLAAFYGAAGPAGDDFTKVELDPARAAGFLTHAGVIAIHSSPDQTNPVRRGAFVRAQMLCEVIAPPPPDVMITTPEVQPGLSTRERFDRHRADPSCSGCHALMDPIGYGFENYDGIGLWRDADAGLPVYATGEIVGVDDPAVAGTFHGVAELGAKLSVSDAFEQCVVRQWFRFAHGRDATDEDAPSLALAERAFASAGGDVLELVVALTITDAFRFRPAIEP